MKNRLINNAFVAALLFSALHIHASQPVLLVQSANSSQFTLNNIAKWGGVAAAVCLGAKGLHCAYKYGWQKKESLHTRVKNLEKAMEGTVNVEKNNGLATVRENQQLVMETLYGIHGAKVVKRMPVTKYGLVGALSEPASRNEFSDAYMSVINADLKAENEEAFNLKKKAPEVSNTSIVSPATDGGAK